MSRYAFRHHKVSSDTDVQIAFGFDHATGYFYQAFDDEGDPVVWQDSMFDGLTGVGLVEFLDGFDDIPPLVVNQQDRESVAWSTIRQRALLDLPF